MTVLGGWMLHAEATTKAKVGADLKAAKTETVNASKKGKKAVGLDKAVIEQMDVAIDAAVALTQLFPGKAAIDVSASAGSNEESIRLVITASRGGVA